MIYLGNTPVGIADGALYKSGSFTGDGTSSVALNIGFAPDVVTIDADVDYATSGWSGIGNAVIVKKQLTMIVRHTNTSASAQATATYIIGENDGDYGNSTGASSYTIYGEYSNGVLTISNKNAGTGREFINGKTYTWKAYACKGVT